MIPKYDAKVVNLAVQDLQRKGGLSRVVPAQHSAMATSAARSANVNESLFRTLIHIESRGIHNRGSSAGAFGYTQLIKGTASDMGVDRMNPVDNLRGGAKYLGQMLHMFHGDVEKAVAAYNAGPGRVINATRNGRLNIGALPAETQNYIAQFRAVLNNGKPLS